MKCNRNIDGGSNCKGIVADYVSQKSSLNSNLNNMKSHIDAISTDLHAFSIPNDYVGSKVTEKITVILSNLLSIGDNIDYYKSDVNNFIEEKKTLHNEHYQNYLWKKEQEKLNATKEGDSHDV